MMKINFPPPSYLTLSIMLFLPFFGCNKNVNTVPTKISSSVTSNNNTNTNGTGSIPTGPNSVPTVAPTTPAPPPYGDATGSSNTTCGSPGIGTQNFDYYRIAIKDHGALQGNIMWSSLNYTGQWSQSIFQTDSRLHVRVTVKANPKICDLPPGYSAPNFDEPYSMLKLAVTIRAKTQTNGGYFEKIQFTDVKVGECSPARSFANIPITNEPLVVEIREVQSDFYCQQYKQAHNGESNGYQYCPYTWVDTKACWEIELHMATDDTKDIP